MEEEGDHLKCETTVQDVTLLIQVNKNIKWSPFISLSQIMSSLISFSFLFFDIKHIPHFLAIVCFVHFYCQDKWKETPKNMLASQQNKAYSKVGDQFYIVLYY